MQMDTDFFGRFMPHGVCYMWEPTILWTSVVADALIALAYFTIPGAILYFLLKRADVRLAVVGWLFAAFIVLCGTTHLFGIWTIWNGDYGLQALVKAATAFVSVLTAAAVWILMPKALAVPSHTMLRREVSLATENLRRANEELASFVSAASHDLKEPLRTLHAYSELLEQDIANKDSARVTQDLDFIQRASTRMRKLVDSLIRLATTGQDAPLLKPVDLNDLTDSVLVSLSALLEDSGATVTKDDLAVIQADETLMRQIYQNLVANAVRHCGHDQNPEVMLTAQRSGDDWVLGVSDNGPGIPEEFRQKIFLPFERLAADREKKEDNGAGIGLAICAKAISRLHGRIWVEGNDDGGSHFRFTIGS